MNFTDVCVDQRLSKVWSCILLKAGFTRKVACKIKKNLVGHYDSLGLQCTYLDELQLIYELCKTKGSPNHTKQQYFATYSVLLCAVNK